MPITLSNGLSYDLSFERVHERRALLDRSLDWHELPNQDVLDVVLYRDDGLPVAYASKSAAHWQAHLWTTDGNDGLRWYDWIRTQNERIETGIAAALAGPAQLPMQAVAPPRWHSVLRDRIHRRGPRRAPAAEWVKFVRAQSESGVGAEEIELSGVTQHLGGTMDEDARADRRQVADLVNIQSLLPRLQLSIDDSFQLSSQWVDRAQQIKGTHHIDRGLPGKWPHSLYVDRYRHRSLGWSVLLARHTDLIQAERKWWLAVDEKGRRIGEQPLHGFPSPEKAQAHAAKMSSTRFVRSAAARHAPHWEQFSQQGLGDYAELLVTLPDWPRTFYSRHFPAVRNLLIHLRTNYSEVEDGRHVLFLDEVQSDWHMALIKQAQRTMVPRRFKVQAAPFARDWPLLALKAALWWAQGRGAAGVAWSGPEQHLDRWRGYRPPTQVYRRGLPDAARRIASTLDLTVSTVRLKRRRVRRIENQPERWVVFNQHGQPTTKAFVDRRQAAHFADLTDAVDWLEAPVIWLDADRPLRGMPLFGVGDSTLWL